MRMKKSSDTALFGETPLRHEGRRINIVASLLLALVALLSGFMGIVSTKKSTEAALQQGLALSLTGGINLLNTVISSAYQEVAELSSRLIVLGAVNAAGTTIGEGESHLTYVRQLGQTMMQSGYSAVRIRDDNSKELYKGGSFSRPQIRVALNFPERAQLRWTEQFSFYVRMPLIHNDKTVGFLEAERPLAAIDTLFTDVKNLGVSGEMLLCASTEHDVYLDMVCFPGRFTPWSLRTQRVLGGIPLPMSEALNGKRETKRATDIRRNNVIVSYGPVGTLGLGMTLQMDSDELFRPVQNQMITGALAVAVLVLMGVILLWWQVAPLVKKLARAEFKTRASNIELQQSQIHYRNLFDNTPLALWEQDWSDVRKYCDTLHMQGIDNLSTYLLSNFEAQMECIALTKWIDVNRTTIELFGARDKDHFIENQRDMFTSESIGDERFILLAFLEGRDTFEYESALKTFSGELINVVVKARLAPGFERYYGRVLFAITDITERKRVENLKSEFVSVVSHELRTPLTAIRGSLGLLRAGVMGPLPEIATETVDVSLRNTERLTRLINDILDIEKIESGRMEFKRSPVNLSVIVTQSIESSNNFAAAAKVSLALESTAHEICVLGDADRLTQVIMNLISNAVKFSAEGDYVVVALNGNNTCARVSITDHGPGVPEDFKNKIFQKFSQADSSPTRKQAGTGLGLTICKAIIEDLGGTIGFDSEPHVATTFYFELPRLG